MLTQIFLHNVNFSARRQKTGNVTIPSLLTSSTSNSRLALVLSTKVVGGAERDRTDDLKLAKLALSQLSYSPNQTRSPP